MEIKGPGKVETSSIRRASRPAGTSGSTFTLADAPETVRGQVVSNSGPLTAVDNILMLQGVDDTLSGRSKGLVHGEELLDMLDEVRDGLLSGGIPRRTLNKIANAVSKRQDGFADPETAERARRDRAARESRACEARTGGPALRLRASGK